MEKKIKTPKNTREIAKRLHEMAQSNLMIITISLAEGDYDFAHDFEKDFHQEMKLLDNLLFMKYGKHCSPTNILKHLDMVLDLVVDNDEPY